MIDQKKFRSKALSQLTSQIGVYALCDLDQVPIYVGQSVDGIRTRVQRHLTSARSDIIANRQIDVWEIGYVWAWPVMDVSQVLPLEEYLFGQFEAVSPLMNGKIMPERIALDFAMPKKQVVQVIEADELAQKLDPALRLPRQISQYLALVDYIQTVKDQPHLKRSLRAHFERLVRYHKKFLE